MRCRSPIGGFSHFKNSKKTWRITWQLVLRSNEKEPRQEDRKKTMANSSWQSKRHCETHSAIWKNTSILERFQKDQRYRESQIVHNWDEAWRVTEKDMLKNAWKVISIWRIERQSNCFKFQALVWTTIKTKRKSLNQLENYLKYAHRLEMLALGQW